MGVVLFFVSWATSALIVWSLYGAFSRGVMRLRGGQYERANDPGRYWLSVGLALIALLLCSALAVVSTLGLLREWK